ncbi:repeat-companion domain-containing protein [Myxococcus fulvus]|uniref:Repeat-companion domain-containing protein n=1 Tax=Myxococcus fulvus TaxID=33 RepID=A0A511TGV1_MYXFU|nr:hypothetical protein [Myxococcus fulvus]GEN12428.1 hypothetical protein MFU01_74650 [Myxococcus fulvus]SET76278.1 repeat-companion domain-containing protein [Myxococcus fulvus]
MSEALHSHLERAVECIARYEEQEALGAVLDAWRECRAPELVVFAQDLEARLDSAEAERAGQAAEARRAARDLARKLEERGTPDEVEARLDAVLGMLPEPRLIAGLLAITRLTSVAEPQAVLKLCAALWHVGPPFDVAPLEALHARMRPAAWAAAARLSSVIGLGLDWVPPELDAKARQLLAELRDAFRVRGAYASRSASILAQWLPRIHANPEDESVRLVMADQLLEVGDPLGELIMLQCSAAPDSERIDALLAKHVRSWELPLGGLVEPGTTRFERGLPVAVRMAGRAASLIPPEPGPAWCSVREINWARVGWSVVHGQWLAHPHLRGVTRMRRVELFWARLMGQPPNVSRLELCGPVGPHLSGTPAAADVFDRLALLPSLSWLELCDAYVSDVSLCANSRLATKLARIDIIGQGRWTLTVTPGAEVPIEATLVSERSIEAFERVLLAAERFGTRALRVRWERRLDAGCVERLRRAASGFSHVDWA